MIQHYIHVIIINVSTDSGEIDQLVWTTTWTRNKTEYCLSQVITLPALGSRICSRTSVYPPEISLTDKGCLGPVGARSILCEVRSKNKYGVQTKTYLKLYSNKF